MHSVAVGVVVTVMIEPVVITIGVVIAVMIEPVVITIGMVVAVTVEPVVGAVGVLVMPRVAYDSAKVLRIRIAVGAEVVQNLAKPHSGFLHRRDLVAAHRHPAVLPDFRRSERAGDRLLAR
jgi:hypothetical protein